MHMKRANQIMSRKFGRVAILPKESHFSLPEVKVQPSGLKTEFTRLMMANYESQGCGIQYYELIKKIN